MGKYGLAIGCNYSSLKINKLNGCINDAMNLKAFLEKNGYSIKTMTDNNIGSNMYPTRDNILREVRNIIRNAVDGDNIFIAFSGHGGQVKTTSKEETDGKNELIYPVDSIIEFTINGNIGARVDATKIILDDEFNNMLKSELTSNKRPNLKIFYMFDACHSGTVLDLQYNYDQSIGSSFFNSLSNKLDNQVMMISGCRDNQVSADFNFGTSVQGAMTNAFLEAMKTTNIQNNVFNLVNKMIQVIRQNGIYGQIPQLSSTFDLKKPLNKNNMWFPFTTSTVPINNNAPINQRSLTSIYNINNSDSTNKSQNNKSQNNRVVPYNNLSYSYTFVPK